MVRVAFKVEMLCMRNGSGNRKDIVAESRASAEEAEVAKFFPCTRWRDWYIDASDMAGAARTWRDSISAATGPGAK